MADKPSVSLIGPGTVGLTLCRFLQNKGYPIISVIGRTEESSDRVERFLGHVTFSVELKDALPDSNIIMVTASDHALPAIAEKLSKLPVSGKLFFHTSGFKSYHIFDVLQKKGAETGSIHPLQSFVHVEESIRSLPGTYYAIEGTDNAVATAQNLIGDLEGIHFSVNPDMKTLYHAGASLSANYFLSILHVAEAFFKKSGVEQEKIIPALTGLLKGIIRNMETRGILDSITGPISRGDHETLQLQLDTIRKHVPRHLPVFRALSLQCANAVFERAESNPDIVDQIMWVLERNLLEDSISSESEETVPHKTHNPS